MAAAHSLFYCMSTEISSTPSPQKHTATMSNYWRSCKSWTDVTELLSLFFLHTFRNSNTLTDAQRDAGFKPTYRTDLWWSSGAGSPQLQPWLQHSVPDIQGVTSTLLTQIVDISPETNVWQRTWGLLRSFERVHWSTLQETF